MQKRTNNPLLHLLSWLYGCGVGFRNFLFNQGVLKGETYPVPLICVGNITVGGTGKTPHIELIVSLLSPSYRIAIISRGYKRKSHGQRVVTRTSTVSEVGDEPRQLGLKYPHVRIIVDGDRRRAMRHLMSLPEGERPDVVLLDDGFQHRYVHPSFSILLVDAQRELHEDTLLPVGTLREPASARYRADCIVLTKCPSNLQPINLRIMQRNLALYPHQRIFFSRVIYRDPAPLASLERDSEHTAHDSQHQTLPSGTSVIALAGIASPKPFYDYLERHYKVVSRITFQDHHNFRTKDLEHIRSVWQREQAIVGADEPVYIIATEKDAVRLFDLKQRLGDELTARVFYLPIATEILYNPEDFKKMIFQAAKALPSGLRPHL